MIPRVNDLITRNEQGERCVYRVISVDATTRTVRLEPVSVAGYQAIGLPVKATIERRAAEHNM